MNLKVFPVTVNHEGNKIPLINQWKLKASNDPDQIKQWQEFFRDRIKLWGCPTGSINGFMALDVDVKKSNGFETLAKNNISIEPTWWQATPSNGAHFLFQHDPTREVGNRVNFLPSLDTRSESGWIALYNLDTSVPLAPMPEWLWQACQKKEREQSPTALIATVSPEIGIEIFNTCLNEIINAASGEGNNVLNTQSYVVGQLIAAGGVSRQYAEQELFKAAVQRGRPEFEAKATIRSGIEGGLNNPKTIDLPPNGPVPLIQMKQVIPSAPTLPDRWTPRFITRAELLDRSKLKKPQLFEDWSTEDIHLTSADGGTGKSTLKLYEAVCLALGSPFLGFRCIKPGRTLFITGEDTAAKLSAILGAILNQMQLLDGSAQNNALVDQVLNSIVIKKDADLCLISKDKQGFLTVNRDSFNKVMQAVDDLAPKMIVFDPIASFWGSESMVNDMNKAVAKFMGELQERSNACIEMINHIGKASSNSKDLNQFAGRGGTGLPSHSRVVRVLQAMKQEEYKDMTGLELEEGKSAMICNVGKFSDGSPLYGKPFIIIRDGYLFSRQAVLPSKEKDAQDFNNDTERVLMCVKNTLRSGTVPTKDGIIALLRQDDDKLTATRVKDALNILSMTGLYGERVKEIQNPDATGSPKILIVENMSGERIL